MDFVQHVRHSRAKHLDDFSNTTTLLLEATMRADQEGLVNVLDKTQGVLEDADMESTETPLHKASALGLNQDGLTPLHLASLMGNLEGLKELICLGKDLCLLKDIYGRTPLHCAAMMGKLEAMEELLGACPESAMAVTARAETPLHVAVIHNQFQAFKLLVEWVEKRDKLELINRKDYGGNTVLHLATSRRQYQTLEILLAGNPAIRAATEVNATNAGGFTAIDILDVLPPCEERDMEIEKTLQRAGALRANFSNKFNPTRHNTKKPFKTLKQRGDKYTIMLLTVALVATTVTFFAALSHPGRTWKEAYDSESESESDSDSNQRSILLNALVPTSLFIFFNSTVFFTSIAMLLHLTSEFPMKPWLLITMSSLLGSYTCSIATISPDVQLNLFFLASPAVFLTAAWIIIVYSRSHLNAKDILGQFQVSKLTIFHT